MKSLYKTLLNLTFFILCYSNYSIAQTNTSPHNKPAFYDKGAVIDSLIKRYSCERIEFTNWDDSECEDSCLTVCLINSTKIPNTAEYGYNVLTSIAFSIKSALSVPDSYLQYNVIFITEKMVLGFKTQAHTFGGIVSRKLLQ